MAKVNSKYSARAYHASPVFRRRSGERLVLRKHLIYTVACWCVSALRHDGLWRALESAERVLK